MREIKFRAWHENSRTMAEFDLYNPATKHVLTVVPLPGAVNLMQFTGLKDKNGQEIYEGDILTADSGKHKLIVEFKDGCYYAQKEDGSEGQPWFMLMQGLDWEVIGNIYEDPELLKGKP